VKGDPQNLGFMTRAIHAGQPPDPATGAVAVPIYQTSTYVQEALGQNKGYEYARVANPTRAALEANVASLEKGASGHAFASGMAAIQALAARLRTGDHVVASRAIYGGTYRFFTRILEERQGIGVTWVDAGDPRRVAAAMTSKTRLVYVETPANPLMDIVDLAAVAEVAHAHDARLAVDNTFLTPYLQRPLELGADLVVHSTTKFLNGHSDSIGGVVVARHAEDGEDLAFVQKAAGAVLGPLDCFLILRGIKTLGPRMDRHQANAATLVELLTGHPKVGRVFYPGLPDHPGHDVHRRQARGFGAVVSFELPSLEDARAVLGRVRVMSLAESLGGVETLISHPASMTHASVLPADRRALGLSDGLIRISVGIEEVSDLEADLLQALDGAG
jgi:cystathionine beta-lyase/cystathionine gamma-synthase